MESLDPRDRILGKWKVNPWMSLQKTKWKSAKYFQQVIHCESFSWKLMKRIHILLRFYPSSDIKAYITNTKDCMVGRSLLWIIGCIYSSCSTWQVNAGWTIVCERHNCYVSLVGPLLFAEHHYTIYRLSFTSFSCHGTLTLDSQLQQWFREIA